MAIFLNTGYTLAVTTTDDQMIDKARAIAEQLHLPFVKTATDLPWVMILSPDHLAMRFPGAKKPFAVNFLEGAYVHRLQQASRNKEPLARAVGLKSDTECQVLDGTAGWGSDAVLLAKLGARVTAIERSPIVAALLADGLRRLNFAPAFSELAIHIEIADTVEYLKTTSTIPDVIYLDPMFPETPNTAQVKKPMQLLQAFVGETLNAEKLVSAALSSGCKRVVVKRPTWAEFLLQKPSFAVPAGMIRFDVYVKTV